MRIRSLKPQWLEDEFMVTATTAARVCSVALILLVDDYGNGRFVPSMLAARIFPASKNPRSVFQAAFEELEAMRFVGRYEIDGQTYFTIRNWNKHQRVHKAGLPSCPPPPNLHQMFTGPPRNPRGTSPADKEKEKEKELSSSKELLSRSERDPFDSKNVSALFAYWQTATGKTKARLKGKLGTKRRRQLGDAVKAYGLDDCKRVVDGAMASPNHNGIGGNPEYLSIDLLFRDAEHIERFQGYATKTPKRFGAPEVLSSAEQGNALRAARNKLINERGNQ